MRDCCNLSAAWMKKNVSGVHEIRTESSAVRTGNLLILLVLGVRRFVEKTNRQTEEVFKSSKEKKKHLPTGSEDLFYTASHDQTRILITDESKPAFECSYNRAAVFFWCSANWSFLNLTQSIHLLRIMELLGSILHSWWHSPDHRRKEIQTHISHHSGPTINLWSTTEEKAHTRSRRTSQLQANERTQHGFEPGCKPLHHSAAINLLNIPRNISTRTSHT